MSNTDPLDRKIQAARERGFEKGYLNECITNPYPMGDLRQAWIEGYAAGQRAREERIKATRELGEKAQ